MSTSDIAKTILESIPEFYKLLDSAYLVWTIACVLLFVSLPVAVIIILQKVSANKLYLYEPTAKKKLHYGFMTVMCMVTAYQFALYWTRYSNCLILRAILVLLAAAAAISILALLNWRPVGIVTAYIWLLLLAVMKNYFYRIVCMTDNIADYDIPGKRQMMIIHEYGYFNAEMWSLFAVIIAVFLAMYYYRRRLLFRGIPNNQAGRNAVSDVNGVSNLDGVLRADNCSVNVTDNIDTDFKHSNILVRCLKCGTPVLRGDNYCIGCGQAAVMNPIKDSYVRLDDEKYDRRSGKISSLLGMIEEWRDEKVRSIASGICLVILVLLVLFAVRMDMSVLNGRNSAATAFLDKFNVFYEDPTVAKDPVWLAGFNAALDGFYNVESRWFYLRPSDINSRNIAFYIAYSDAAYEQMKILEKIKELVNSVSGMQEIRTEEIDDKKAEIADQYNYYANQIAQSVTDYSTTSSELLWVYLRLIVMDTLHCYFGYQGALRIAGIIGIIFGFLCILFLLNRFSDMKKMRMVWFTERFVTLLFNPVQGSGLRQSGIGAYSVFIGCWYMIRMISGFAVLILLLPLSIAGEPGSIVRLVKWLKYGLRHENDTDNYRNVKAKSRILNGVITIIITLALAIFLNSGGSSSPGMTALSGQEIIDIDKMTSLSESQALNLMYMGYYESIISKLLKVQSGEIQEHEDVQAVIESINAQIELDRLFIEMLQKTELIDTEAKNGLISLFQNEVSLLDTITDTLESSGIPTQEQLGTYAELRGKDFKYLLVNISGRAVKDMFETLFD